MKYLIPILIIGCWGALALSGYGIHVRSEMVTYSNGSKYLRCYYVKATRMVKQDIPQAGTLKGTCPNRI